MPSILTLKLLGSDSSGGLFIVWLPPFEKGVGDDGNVPTVFRTGVEAEDTSNPMHESSIELTYSTGFVTRPTIVSKMAVHAER